ncbi:MAG: hypothetical protein LBR81_01840 [Prevotellaceae bacterium]|jgi:hypothetical protein|nr:hypothetical protein [Prevotellaceae bacterium]
MRKIIFTSLAAIIVGLLQVANAQITVRENNVVEKAVLRPEPFDSLTNLIRQKRMIDYKKYIGYKLYFLPIAKNYNSEFKQQNNKITLFTNDSKKIPIKMIIGQAIRTIGQIGGIGASKMEVKTVINGKSLNNKDIETNVYQPKFSYIKESQYTRAIEIETEQEKLYGQYFTILDIEGQDKQTNKFTKLENITDKSSYYLKIWLQNDSNKDTVYWEASTFYWGEDNLSANNSQPFLLVPYFEKQKNMFQDKDMIAVEDLKPLVDINTGQTINIRKGEEWHCYDVSLVDSKNYSHLQGFCFFKKGNEEVMFPIGTIDESMFVTKQEYEQQELEKQKKAEEKAREAEERIKQREQQEKEFRAYCISKWGQQKGTLIADGKVQLGMTREMCTAAWGSPNSINKTIISGLVHEQWVYSGSFLYFDNDVLTGIQE